MVNIVTLRDPRSDTQDHTCSIIFFFFTFSLHRIDISSLPLLFSLFFLSFLLQVRFFQLLLFFLSFFFFFTARFFHLLLFFFLFLFFTLVSFLLFLHAMMAEGFDFNCDLRFNRVKVCFLGLELWILWRNFFWCFFLFLFSLYLCKRICCDVEGVGGSAMVDGFDFW